MNSVRLVSVKIAIGEKTQTVDFEVSICSGEQEIYRASLTLDEVTHLAKSQAAAGGLHALCRAIAFSKPTEYRLLIGRLF